MGRPENLTPWQPGQSGNPGGRPKTAPLSHACRELLARPVPDDPEGRTYAEVIAEMLGKKAIEGDIRAAQEIADRAEGRARQSVEINATAPLHHEITGEERRTADECLRRISVYEADDVSLESSQRQAETVRASRRFLSEKGNRA